ncbi:MAG TPA: hypothetical protein V6C97_28160 [Oculatellaceae cyanobacterium]
MAGTSKRLQTSILFLAVTYFTSLCALADAQGVAPNSESSDSTKFLQGQAASYGQLSEDIQSKMGFTTTTNAIEDIIISDVLKGTAADTCGLKRGDRVLDAQVDGNALDISIERGGKFFTARLRQILPKPVFVTQQAKMDVVKRQSFTLNAEQTVVNDNQLIPEKPTSAAAPKIANIDTKAFSLAIDKNARLLADYNLELIVDRSNSMKKPDCPDGLSRWAWCGVQAANLSKSLTPFTQNGLTIIPFATEYHVFEHATTSNIDQLFNSIALQNGTRLYEPLTERLDNYFAHKKQNSKPLLIVIVTDGLPSPRLEPALVRSTLIEASRRMTNPTDVTVFFCQIGEDDRGGQRYLTDLDQNLTTYGAQYNFVHLIPFERLEQAGLGSSLVAAIQQFAPPLPAVTPTSRKKPSASPAALPAAPKRLTRPSAVEPKISPLKTAAGQGVLR